MSGECFAESINRARPDVAKHDANCTNAQGEQRPLRGMTFMVILFAMTKIVCGLRSNHFVSPAFAPIAVEAFGTRALAWPPTHHNKAIKPAIMDKNNFYQLLRCTRRLGISGLRLQCLRRLQLRLNTCLPLGLRCCERYGLFPEQNGPVEVTGKEPR